MWLFSFLKAFKLASNSQAIPQYLYLFFLYLFIHIDEVPQPLQKATLHLSPVPIPINHKWKHTKSLHNTFCQKSSLLTRIIIATRVVSNLAPQPHSKCLLFKSIYAAHYISLGFPQEQHLYKDSCVCSLFANVILDNRSGTESGMEKREIVISSYLLLANSHPSIAPCALSPHHFWVLHIWLTDVFMYLGWQ